MRFDLRKACRKLVEFWRVRFDLIACRRFAEFWRVRFDYRKGCRKLADVRRVNFFTTVKLVEGLQ